MPCLCKAPTPPSAPEAGRLGARRVDSDRRSSPSPQVAIVALANKMVRICWKVLTTDEAYRPYPARVA